MSKSVLPPEQWKVLYDNVFSSRSTARIVDLLSEGLRAFAQNAAWLVEDAKLLATNGRYARAGFLVATAEEEIAKSYILLDACRLDFEVREERLKRLCKAFYRHVEKYAYYKMVCFKEGLFNRDYPRGMDQVRDLFVNDLQRWWPSRDPQSGEPDLPHETYFAREDNLYVDFTEYNQKWNLPTPDSDFYDLQGRLGVDDKFSECGTALLKLIRTRDEGLYKSEVLAILNEAFRKQYITHRTPIQQIYRLYDVIAEKIEMQFRIPQETFGRSSLNLWPLYAFL